MGAAGAGGGAARAAARSLLLTWLRKERCACEGADGCTGLNVTTCLLEVHKETRSNHKETLALQQERKAAAPLRPSVSLLSPVQGKVKDACIFMGVLGTGSMAFNCFLLVGGGTCQC